jgi:phage/plasmid primase-like uncharacterized protein
MHCASRDDGRVLVPLRDEGGELRNLQTINASGEKTLPAWWPKVRAVALVRHA